MQTAIVILGIVAGVILGVLSNWIYDILRSKGILPDNPAPKYVFVVVIAFIPIVFFVALPSLSSINEATPDSTATNSADEALKILLAVQTEEAELINAIATLQYISQIGNDAYAPTATALAEQYIELESTRAALLTRQPELIDTPISPTPLPISSIVFPVNSGIGSEFIRPNDEMIMSFVPGGTFLMGSTEDDLVAESYEIPQHIVTVNGFWLDKLEVTNDQYTAFLNAQNQSLSDISSWLELDSEFTRISYNNSIFETLPSFADHPVVEVSWAGANEYCHWAGGRLPTEEEWEYAARGTDQRIYPWGNNFDGTKLNFCDVNCPRDWRYSAINDGYTMTSPVGSFPLGQSWTGIFDLAGNVAEWTANGLYEYEESGNANPLFSEGGFHKVVRGGSWANTDRFTRVTNRTYPSPNEQSEFIGFRCAATP